MLEYHISGNGVCLPVLAELLALSREYFSKEESIIKMQTLGT